MYVLQDYLEVLHRKFLVENPSKRVSMSFFRGVREKNRYIKLVRYNLMNACLCKTHENMRLLIKATTGLSFNASPDEFIEEVGVAAAREKLEKMTGPIRYREWCTVPVTYGNVVKKHVKLTEQTADTTEFTAKFIALMHVFKGHVARVIAEYTALHTLKATLPKGHVTVQMDFAENWSVCTSREIQSAYFAKDQLSIHPVLSITVPTEISSISPTSLCRMRGAMELRRCTLS